MLRHSRLVALGLSGSAAQGLALTADLPEPSLVPLAQVDLLLARGQLRLWSDDIPGAHRDLLGAVANSQGGSVPLRLASATALAQAQYRSGDWGEALTHAEAAVTLAEATGHAWLEPAARLVAALVLSARGAWEGASEHLRFADDPSGRVDGVAALAHAACAQGYFADARAEPEGVVSALTPLLRLASLDGVDEPGVLMWRDLLADALIDTGELVRAETVLMPLERRAAVRGHHSGLAAAARIRGHLHAARREPVEAEDAFRRALQHATRVPDPFARARVELEYGAHLRRLGRRSAAVLHLVPACHAFARLGAVPYRVRCERELDGCGRAAPAQRSSATRAGASRRAADVLTPQELAVARLAAQGLTNRRIARELELSVKTIEYHLNHAYTKFGITSRVGLVSRLGPQGLPQGDL